MNTDDLLQLHRDFHAQAPCPGLPTCYVCKAEAAAAQSKSTDLREGESNRDYAMRRALSIEKDELIRSLLGYIGKRGKRPLWARVSDATTHGSQISQAIVDLYGRESK